MSSWIELDVGGHACDVYEPSRRNEFEYVLIYLHGVHQDRLVDQPRFIEQFDRHGLPVIAPLTGGSWWTDKICADFDPQLTAERHILDNILPELASRWGSRPPRIGLLGTGMGGQGALRLAYKYPNIFPVTAAIAPAIDYQCCYEEDEMIQQMYPDPEAVRQDTATLHIHPLNWPRHQFFCCDPTDFCWWDSTDRLRMKLSSLGVPHECDLETEGGGHGFVYHNTMAERAVQFLADRLDQERRRLV